MDAIRAKFKQKHGRDMTADENLKYFVGLVPVGHSMISRRRDPQSRSEDSNINEDDWRKDR